MTAEIFEEEDIPLAEFENIGLSKDGRLDLGEHDLKALLAGLRTDTIRLHNLEDGDMKILNLDAKLSLHRNEQGHLDLLIHPVYRREKAPGFLTAEETEKLVNGKLANVNKVVEINGVKREILVEFDKEFNEFIIVDTDRILVPDFVNNEQLTPEQKLRFKKGKEVELEDGTKFQFSAKDPKAIRSNKLHLIVSLLMDGGISYLLLKGLKALPGQQHDKVSQDYSRGYYQALEDMKVRQVKDRMQGNNVRSR